MAEAPPANATALVEVDLPGGKLSLPKEQAELVIKARDGWKGEARTAAERLGAAEAERARVAEEAAKAQRAAEIAAAEKAGEGAKVRELLTKQHAEERAKLHARIADRELRAAIVGQPGVVAGAIEDILRAASGTYQVSDAGDLVFRDAAGQPAKDAEGKPLTADAWAKSFLEQRPYFRTVTVPAGGNGKPAPAAAPAQTIKRSQVDPANAEQFRGIAAKTIRVIDD